MKDKIVIITGGSSGIGLAAATLLTAQGAKVVIAAPEGESLAQAAANLKSALAIPTDVTQEQSVRGMIQKTHKQFGRIDVLINNAGRGYEGPLEFVEVDKLRYLFDLHVVGPLIAMQAVLPIMRRQGGGRIINVSTPTAKMAIPGLGAYSTTKAALTYLTQVERKELAKDNIIVSAFYPFITASNFGKNRLQTNTGELFSKSSKPDFLPNPDTPEFTAARLVQSIASHKKEFMARGNLHFVWGVIKKKFKK